MSIRNNHVLVFGVDVELSVLNRDFDGQQKHTADGMYFASPYSVKYPMKKYLREVKGRNILGLARYGYNKDKILCALPKKEVLKEIFAKAKISKTDKVEMIKEVLNFNDVQLFGDVVTEPLNFGLLGLVQCNQGVNIYGDTNTIYSNVLSPYASGEDKLKTTLGNSYILDKACFVYTMNVIPETNKFLYADLGIEKELDDDLYKDLKEAIKYGTSYCTTSSKANNYVGFLIDIELSDKVVLGSNLNKFIKVRVEDNKFIYDFTELSKYLETKKKYIEKAVVSLDYGVEIEGWNFEVEEF